MNIDQTDRYDFEKEFAQETVQALQAILKIDTTNPPGNETRAAEWIYNYLSKEGIDAEVIESAPGRGNVISRLKGDSTAPSLLLLSHVDVVPSQDVEKWTMPPFSGEIKDGFIWGRGAIDMKSTTISQLMTYIKLHRDQVKPKSDIVLAATADEECGGNFGAGWLLNNKFETIKTDHVVTEGGGQLLPMKTKIPHYIIQISEKGMFWTQLRTQGAAGHGSMPHPAKEQAIVKMTQVINKIAKYSSPIIIQDLFKNTVHAMDLPAAALTTRIFTSKRLVKLGIRLANRLMKQDLDVMILPLVQNKITPTILRAGQKENNVPGVCELTLDARLLPGFNRDDLYKELAKILGKKLFQMLEFRPILDQPGGLTPPDTDFAQIITQTIGEIDPGAKLVPILSPGSTDMLHFRKKGIKAYGFVPMRIDKGLTAKEFASLPHGYDERISINNLMLATRFFYNLSLKY